MGTLDTAVRMAEHWSADKRASRAQLIEYIQDILSCYDEAKRIWQEYTASKPQAPVSGSRWTILNWIGADRAHRLWMINRRINDRFAWIASLTGAALPWSFPTDEVMIDAADKQLVQLGDEVGPRAAKTAIERIDERVAHARTLLAEIESIAG